MFDIISFGEFRMLEQALNGLAAITATGSFGEMMRVAFLVGILTFGARALMSNKWDAIPLLTGFIAYSVMFTPKVTTTVTDAYGGGTVVVANVPIGLAAPLAITSHVGRFLSTTFESAFSVITPGSSYLQNGYMEPLTVLLKMRDGSFGYANSDTTNNGNFERTLNAYIVQCVYYDLELDDGSVHEVTAEGIKKSANTLDAIKTTFMNISVLTEVPGIDPPGGTIRTCGDAYNTIKAGFDGTWVDLYFDNYLQSKLQAPVNTTAGTAQDRVGAALNAIQLSSADARMYMVNTLLANVVKKGEAGYSASHGDVSSAIIRTQALEQRNVEWAAEKSLFEKIARPVTAFIEVFMVCGGPIMAFAIAAFGPAGLSTLTKFLMMHVWVCLWMPTMTICNMYLYTQINRYVTTVGGSTGANLLSYGSMDDLNAQLQTWVAVGSMLAAATPTLTLMLIWGSNQVATTLASRMHSSGHVDPTIAAPPIVSSAPFVQNQSGYGGNPDMPSYTKTGASQQSLSYNNTLVDQEASAAQRMHSTQDQASKTLSRTLTSGLQGVDSVSVNDSGQISASGSRGKEVTSAYNTAFQAAKDANLSDAKASRFAVGVSTNMSAEGGAGVNVGVLKAGVSTGLSTKIASDTGLSQGDSLAAMTKLSEGVQSGKGVYAKFAETMQQSHTSSSGWSFNHATGDASAQQYGKQVTEAESASKSYGEIAMANRVMGNSTSWTAPQLAQDLKQSPILGGQNWTSNVGRAFEQSFGGDTRKQAAALNQIMSTPSFQNSTQSMSDRERTATAQGILMLSNAEAGGGKIFASLAGVAGKDQARAEAGMPDSGRNSGVAANAPSAGTVAFAADVGTHRAGVLASDNAVRAGISGYVDERVPQATAASTNSGAPGKFYQGGIPAVDAATAQGTKDAGAAGETFAGDVKRRQAESTRTAATTAGEQRKENLDKVSGLLISGDWETPEQKQAGAARVDAWNALPQEERMARRYKAWGGKRPAPKTE